MIPGAFDIETVPTAAALALPYPADERTPPATYSKPETIAAWYVKDRAEWEQARIKQYSLSPLVGRVVAVGMAFDPPHDMDTAIQTNSLIAPSEGDEAQLLNRFWTWAQGFQPLVSWNGHGFDIPFLLTRSALLGVNVPLTGLLARYKTVAHYDVKQIVNNWDNQRIRSKDGTLDHWCQAFGLPGKIAHGSQVYEMAMAGRYEEIGAYAADDAHKTLLLYHKVHHIFL